MTLYRRKRTHHARKAIKRSHRTCEMVKCLDQISDIMYRDRSGTNFKPVVLVDDQSDVDEELPGDGNHRCVPCDRDFTSDAILQKHKRQKNHKKRVKLLKEVPYSLEEAAAAAGRGNYTDLIEKKKYLKME